MKHHLPLIMAIDPGKEGAIALYDPERDDLSFFDMPLTKIKKDGKTRSSIDLYSLGMFVDAHRNRIRFAVVEEVGARPGEGVVSVFSFGFAAAAAQCVAAFNMIPLHLVRPATWKKELGMMAGADKEYSRLFADRVMPQHMAQWPLKKHHGRADAALLAYYGKRFF